VKNYITFLTPYFTLQMVGFGSLLSYNSLKPLCEILPEPRLLKRWKFWGGTNDLADQ